MSYCVVYYLCIRVNKINKYIFIFQLQFVVWFVSEICRWGKNLMALNNSVCYFGGRFLSPFLNSCTSYFFMIVVSFHCTSIMLRAKYIVKYIMTYLQESYIVKGFHTLATAEIWNPIEIYLKESYLSQRIFYIFNGWHILLNMINSFPMSKFLIQNISFTLKSKKYKLKLKNIWNVLKF